MRFTHFREWIVLIGAVALTTAAVAQETMPATPTSAPAPTSNPIVNAPGALAPDQPAAPARPHHTRVISSDVAAQISAATPKYTPPPPKPPPTPEDDLPDMRDIDKPKNGIIRLPKYVVHEKPPPVLNERAVNTKKGLSDLAMKRYLTEFDRALNAFTLPLFGTSPEQRALAMYAEDERLKNMADLNEDVRMISAQDKAAGMYVKRAVDSTFQRDGNFDWKPIGK